MKLFDKYINLINNLPPTIFLVRNIITQNNLGLNMKTEAVLTDIY